MFEAGPLMTSFGMTLAQATPMDPEAVRAVAHLNRWAGLGVVLLGLTIVLLRTRLRPAKIDGQAGRALAIFSLVTVVVHQIFWLTPAYFDWKLTLPLHWCDIAGLVGPIALLWPKRALRALLYFWVFGLSTQALVQPTVREPTVTLKFVLFWLTHGTIVWCAVYDLAVRGFRPTWRDWRTAVLVSLGYMVFIATVDGLMGWRYAFVGPDYEGQPAILDFFGPWPMRLIPMVFAVAAMYTLLWWLGRQWGGTKPKLTPQAS